MKETNSDELYRRIQVDLEIQVEEAVVYPTTSATETATTAECKLTF